VAVSNRTDCHYSFRTGSRGPRAAPSKTRNLPRQPSQSATNGEGRTPSLLLIASAGRLASTIVVPHPSQVTSPTESAMTRRTVRPVKKFAEVDLLSRIGPTRCPGFYHRSRCLSKSTTETVQSGVGSTEVRTLALIR